MSGIKSPNIEAFPTLHRLSRKTLNLLVPGWVLDVLAPRTVSHHCLLFINDRPQHFDIATQTDGDNREEQLKWPPFSTNTRGLSLGDPLYCTENFSHYC